MKFAKIVFWIAVVWGFLVLTPLLFLFDKIGAQDPPPITHPGFYYGFVTVALAFQTVFLVIARDPVRMRPMMIPAVIEKFSYCDCRSRALPAGAYEGPRPGVRRGGRLAGSAVRGGVGEDAQFPPGDVNTTKPPAWEARR